jgi:uncharacterized membrane protein
MAGYGAELVRYMPAAPAMARSMISAKIAQPGWRPRVTVRGALRITRHPFLWGVALLAVGHMATVPSPRSLVLFGTLLAVALAGTLSIDAKRRRKLGLHWAPYAAVTSNLPFAAILAGRQPLKPAELRVRDLLVAGLLIAGTALAHPTIRRALFP